MFSFSHPFRVADSGVYSVLGRKGERVSTERKARSGRVYGEFKHKGKKTRRVSLVDLHTIHAFYGSSCLCGQSPSFWEMSSIRSMGLTARAAMSGSTSMDGDSSRRQA